MAETYALLAVNPDLMLELLLTSAADVSLQVFDLLHLLPILGLQVDHLPLQIHNEVTVSLNSAVVRELGCGWCEAIVRVLLEVQIVDASVFSL